MNKSKNVISFWPLTITVAIILCSTCVVSAAMDYNPPTWRGDAGSTMQGWAFEGTGTTAPIPPANPSNPDIPYDNSNSPPPSLMVNGTSSDRVWLPTDSAHTGIWRLEDNVIIDIPNFPQQNPYKDVYLQMTFKADGTFPNDIAPIVSVTPLVGTSTIMTLLDITAADGAGYHNATFQARLFPNPTGEIINIIPRYCSIYIDDIVVDTICVPEPMTLSLLGAGGLALLRKRRRG